MATSSDTKRLDIELYGPDNLEITIRGNATDLAPALQKIMDVDEGIAGFLSAAVVDYCIRNKVSVHDLNVILKAMGFAEWH